MQLGDTQGQWSLPAAASIFFHAVPLAKPMPGVSFPVALS